MGANQSLLKSALEVIPPIRRRTRAEEMEMLREPQKMLRTGSVTKSIQRHLGQPKAERHEPPPRETKSLDYVWEPHPEYWKSLTGGLGDDVSVTDSVRPRVPNPSMPQDDDASVTASTTETPTRLCDACAGITIESITSDTGYWHRLLSELSGPALNCDLCSRFATNLALNNQTYTTDRYRVVISLELHSTPPGVVQSYSGHFNASSIPWHECYIRSHMRFSIMDCRPWEDPDLAPYLCSWADTPREYTVPEGSEPEVVISSTVPILTNEFDAASECGVDVVREIGRDTASERSFELAAAWLESCLSSEPAPRKSAWVPHLQQSYGVPSAERPPVEVEHAWTLQEATATRQPGSLLAETPARLIEIRQGSEMVRLIETRKATHQQSEPFRFAALSYCWGKPEAQNGVPWWTTKANADNHLLEISRNVLPKTLQDGIMVAEKLDIPYIWIDALCIVQDDPDDWSREAAKMSGIYLGSLLTIAVSSSTSGSEGCFNQNSEPTIGSADFNKVWATVDATLEDGRRSRLYIGGSREVNPETNMYKENVLKSPLATRAWTLQEHVLPPRTLFYTSKQLVWKCSHCLLNEDSFPQPQQQHLYPIMDYNFPLGPDAIDELWYRGIVEQYSTRHLTFGSDKLVALSGLAKATYLNRHVPYIAGLWKDCLLSGLLWKREASGCKSRTYACPSWSWASQNSAVSYWWANGRAYDASTFTPRIMDVQWTPSVANAFGDVESACIYLDTKIRLGTVTRDFTLAGKFKERGDDDCQALLFSDPESTKIWLAQAKMDDEHAMGGRVTIATMLGTPAATPVFLLLDPPDLDASEYRRVGIAQLDCHSNFGYAKPEPGGDMTLRWKQRTIKLV